MKVVGKHVKLNNILGVEGLKKVLLLRRAPYSY